MIFTKMNLLLSYIFMVGNLIFCYGLDYNRHNANTDFILYESGGGTRSSPKRDYVAPTNTGSTRGNVNPFPPLPGASTPAPSTNSWASRNTQPTEKRDYVAPLPNAGNSQQSTGAVKNVVNFYNNQNNANQAQTVPSYSNVVRGTTNTVAMQGSTRYTPSPFPNNPGRPVSFSAAVAGVTNGPSTRLTTPTTSRPIVLPSSLLNSTNNQNGNANGVTNLELQTLSEELLRKDINNAARYITINYQGKTNSQTSEDRAPLPLLTVEPAAWNIPTIQKLLPLLDNYERNTYTNEYVTPQERIEENEFMDAIMSTAVIRSLMNFLKDKGYVTPDPRQQKEFLKQLWFGLYSRGKGKIGSSGFEHVFLSELKDNNVMGMHNWIYFAKEELANRVNYLGYNKYTELSDKGVIIKFRLTQQGTLKPTNTISIGTSPELDIALFTLCFVTRPNDDCDVKLGNKDVKIFAHNFRYRSKNYIGSAYTQI